MVIPEREVPGMSASAWATPTTAASHQVSSSSSRRRAPARSAHHSSRPKPIEVEAMTSGLRAAEATRWYASSPARPTGMVPSATAQARRASVVSRGGRAASSSAPAAPASALPQPTSAPALRSPATVSRATSWRR